MQRRGYFYTDLLQHELNDIKEPEEIYYPIEFEEGFKRNVNPSKLTNSFSNTCSQKDNELTTDNKNGFSFKVKRNQKLNQSSDIGDFEAFSCEIIFHNLLSITKGGIYL